MAITVKDVEHVAKLARLELTEEEKEKFTRQLGDVLKYVDQMNEVDTANVEPLSGVSAESGNRKLRPVRRRETGAGAGQPRRRRRHRAADPRLL